MTRARDLGIPFDGTPGKWNAITDVGGVEVGHTTIIKGEGKLVVGEGPVRTGVTAILPAGKKYNPLFAAWHSFSGCGELTGTTWVEESGFLESAILITDTSSVGVVSNATVRWAMENIPIDWENARDVFWSLPVVGETFSGFLNDMRGFHVKPEHVYAALQGAQNGPVQEGNVGGGTPMMCHEFKGGIGTASRLVEIEGVTYTLGVLVQANYGDRASLQIAGTPVGKEITDLMPEIGFEPADSGKSSIITVVATDAPLLPHQLKRLVKRAPLGIGRVGGMGNNDSGDLLIAFSTANASVPMDKVVWQADYLRNACQTPLFYAVVHAVEEAIVNALVAAETMQGIDDHIIYALPHDRLQQVLKKYNRLIV